MPENLDQFERTLAALAPVAPRLDRDAVMYEAGRGSSRRHWIWPTAAWGFALLAAGFGIRLASRDARVVERIVVVREEASPSKSAETPTKVDSKFAFERSDATGDSGPNGRTPYLELQREILLNGDVPPPLAPPESAGGARPLPSLDHELDLPPQRLRGLHLSPTS